MGIVLPSGNECVKIIISVFWLISFQALFIRMSKHPSCFRLTGDIPSDWTEDEGRRVLLRGSVAELCPLAPNNVNTMAAAAVAAGTLGFDGVRGEIVSDTAWVLLNTWFNLMQPFISAYITLFIPPPATGYMTTMWWRWRWQGLVASQYTLWGGIQPNSELWPAVRRTTLSGTVYLVSPAHTVTYPDGCCKSIY